MIEIEEAVNKLKGFGLTKYESKAFVNLIHLGESTAREISDSTGIPRTKIYDVLRKLAEKGFIEIQPGNPTLFKALEPLEVAGKLHKDTVKRINEFVTLVENIKVEKRKNVHHVWVARGKFAVESKIRDILKFAENELLIFIIDPDFKVDITKSDITRILLYEKVSSPNSSFRVIDKDKIINSGDFFKKFAELLDGYTFNEVNFKPIFLGIADGKKSILVLNEEKEFVAVITMIPMIVLLQKVMFESLWENFTL